MQGTKKMYYVLMEQPTGAGGIYSSMEKAKEAIVEFAEGAPVIWFDSVFAGEEKGMIEFSDYHAYFQIGYYWLDGSIGLW